ncbi:hemagglutinin repeat-containing protein [Achromobacter xylosoxidans]
MPRPSWRGRSYPDGRGRKDATGTGNLSIIGSDLAGRNVLLAATNDLMLQSQAETATEVSTSKNSGWKVGVGIGVADSGSGGGINIFASGYWAVARPAPATARTIARRRSARETTSRCFPGATPCWRAPRRAPTASAPISAAT